MVSGGAGAPGPRGEGSRGPLFFRAVGGKHLLATVGGETADFVALTTASTPGPDAKGPFEDQITIDHWRQRLHVLVDEAVLS